ncbi:MAG: FadR family transcriptional regulator [Lentisphaeria bacterium]|nr:FadR family transcriptional regulator [Lentisphaeria bacterium]
METLVDDIENRFLQYFRKKRFTVGDILPREVELSEDLHVSRHIVREGISRLKAIGVVESRKRRGTVICRPSPFLGFEKVVHAGLYDPVDQKNYMELRVAIELGMSHFIFARKTPEKIEHLKKLAGFSPRSVYDSTSEVDFHTCLIAIADNTAATDFRRILLLAMESLEGGTVKPDPPSHQKICEVLEHGSAADFYQIIYKHLETYLP